MREFESQPAVLHAPLTMTAHMLEFLMRSVPRHRSWRIRCMFTAPFSILTLPSMNIVPCTVSTFATASQVSSPAAVRQL